MKLSVLLTAFNHEKYIARAVESVLEQRTNFDLELVIGEDCSSDRTRDVVIALQDRHPDKIRLLLREQNLGMLRNSIETYLACQGEYVALLDGDDYWVSPHKLQRQVDFLDSHPECVLSCHNALILFEEGTNRPEGLYCRPDQKELCDLEDLLQENFIAPCSLVCRNGLITEFPDWIQGLVCADWAFFLLLAQHGKIGYLADTMGVIRKLSSGAWTGIGAEARIRSLEKMYQHINEHLGFRYDALIRALIPKWVAIQRLEAAYQNWQETIRGWEQRYQQLQAEKSAALAEAAAVAGQAEIDWRGTADQLESARASTVDALTERFRRAVAEHEEAERQAAEYRRLVEQQETQLVGLAAGVQSLVGRGDELHDRLLTMLPAVERTLDELENSVLVQRIHDAALAALPERAHVLVVSKGDDELLRLAGGREARHFPQDEGGSYLGHHPADSDEAIARLEAQRAAGAEYLLFPSTAFWWLDHYTDFRRHLDEHYARTWDDERCIIYRLAEAPVSNGQYATPAGEVEQELPTRDQSNGRPSSASPATPNEAGPAIAERYSVLEIPDPLALLHGKAEAAPGPQLTAATSGPNEADYRELARLVREVVARAVPPGATVLVASGGDDALLELDGRPAWHFPQDEHGSYAGFAGTHGTALIQQIELLRFKGAQFLVIPLTAYADLARFPELRNHLQLFYSMAPQTAGAEAICLVLDLGELTESPDGLPLPPPQLVFLVSNQYNVHYFCRVGVLGAECIRGILAKNGIDLNSFEAILDFGCGCGRVIRQWKDLSGPRLYGTDYNPALIAWCRSNLPFAEFGTNQLAPPLDYADEQFDFLYAISVFTHLPEELQFSWIRELARVVKPGGYLYLTMHGVSRAHLLPPDLRARFDAGEFAVMGQECSGSNACATFHPESYVREILAKAGGLKVIDFAPEGAKDALQDAFLLQKPPHPEPAATEADAALPRTAVSVIVCSRDEAKLAEVSQHYRGLLGEEGVEIVAIRDARSLCEGYNRGVRASTGDLLIFSHDDVEVLAPDLGEQLRRYLDQYDVIGVAGTTRLIEPLWDAAGLPYVYGQVAHEDAAAGDFHVAIWGAPTRCVGGIQALDGCFFACKRQVAESVRFDEQTFDGFHLYDLDFTFSAHLRGFQLAVCNDIPVIHKSIGKFDEVWAGYARRFREKHAAHLFPMKARPFYRPVVTVKSRDEVLELMTPPHWNTPSPPAAEAPAPTEGTGSIYSTFWNSYVQNWKQINQGYGDKYEWPGDEWGFPEAWDLIHRAFFIPAGVQGWQRAVEIGPGSGKYTLKVLENSAAEVRAYDVSAAYLNVCAHRCGEWMERGRLALNWLPTDRPDRMLADLDAAGWRRTVDGFYSMDAMVHVDLQYLIAYLLTAALTLKPGGKLILSLADVTTGEGFQKLLDDLLPLYAYQGQPSPKMEWVCPEMLGSLLPRLGFQADQLYQAPRDLYVVATLANPAAADALERFLVAPSA